MTTQNIELSNEIGIDKYDGSFEKEESGCTIFINKTVNSIKRLDVGGLYLYLICRPPSWKLNVKHLSSLFDCNKDKIYKIIDALIEMHLLTRTETRLKGKFLRYHYRVHLRPTETESVQIAPVLEKPDTVKPDTVKADAYKTKKVIIKESIKSYCASANAHNKSDVSFDKFWEYYPVKKNKIRSKKIWEKNKYKQIDTLIFKDIRNRLDNDVQWKDPQFIPHPATYLRNRLWEDEVLHIKDKVHSITSSINSLRDKSASFNKFLNLNEY